MGRTVSADFLEAAFASETAENLIALVEINHTKWASPYYFTSDSEETVSNGKTYVPMRFDLKLPDDVERSVPRATLVLDGVGRELVADIRNVISPPAVTVHAVLADSPDTIEATWSGFELVSAGYDSLAFQCEISPQDYSHEPVPGDVMMPAAFPGLF